MPEPDRSIAIVGLHGGQWFGRDAEAALWSADVLIGHARQLEALPDGLPGEPVELWGDLDEVLGFAAAQQVEGRRACVLASGDPGFFGLVRLASARLGATRIREFPAPSSVSLAFARVGCSWDDAEVVSAHGRPLEPAVEAVLSHPKVAVLVSRDQPPESLGRALVGAACGPRDVAVCSRLGEADESVLHTNLEGLAEGKYDPLSVVLFRAPAALPDWVSTDPVDRPGEAPSSLDPYRLDEAPGARPPAERPQPAGDPGQGGPGVAWGRSEARFAHRAGMVTKAEVRAVALGKLALPPAGVLWDVGAASGSVAIECARLAPGLRVFAIEQRADDVARLEENVRSAGVGVTVSVVHGKAPDALAGLPDPDRAFVGGGGLKVLDAVVARLRPGGAAAATYAVPATAAAAAQRLGNLVQVHVSRGVPVGESGDLRLAAENPVFICWGPA